MPLAPGDVIADKYRIEKPLGEGRMGRVWVATHGVLRKQVALKVMEERFRVSNDLVERFFREAVAAGKVDHPAITQVFDAGVHEGSPFMVMELLHGEDLSQRLEREQRLSLEETLLMARPILSALDAAHRAGVVHRDIKPPNIFLAKRADGIVTPKLLDFGIAKHMGNPFFDRLTGTGSVIGTPLYLAPEQVQSETGVDHRADIYSVGVTLFHCLSGTTPYEAASFPELIGKMFSEGPRSLAAVAPDIPPAVSEVIQRCLAHRPGDRPQTALALLEGLDQAASGASAVADEQKTEFLAWGSEVSSPAQPQPPPTRYVPVAPASEPPSPVPTRRGTAAPASEPPQSSRGGEVFERRAPSKDRRWLVGALAGVALLGFGTLAALGLWLFVLSPKETPAADPPSVVTPTTDPPPAEDPLDAGAPMEPSQVPVRGDPAPNTAGPEEVEGRAQLEVRADPSGECFIDGERVGVTPLTEWVAAGPHSIAVVYGPLRQRTEEIVLRPGEYRVLSLGDVAE